MTIPNTKKLVAIGLGFGIGASLGMVMYSGWHRPNGCIQTLSKGSQEVVYSWGCSHPQRYRQWSLVASTQEGSNDRPVLRTEDCCAYPAKEHELNKV